MKSSLSSASSFARACLALVLAALTFTAVACSDDEESAEDRQISELDDQEWVAECNAQRKDIGSEAAAGYQRYLCLAASTPAGGSCNTTIFENCISVKQSACMAPPAGSPERTCEATVAEDRACQVAFISQHSAYQSVSCAMPPTSQPKARAALSQCDALCTKCPDLCAEVGI